MTNDEEESMFAHPHISVALFSTLAAYSLILISLLAFALSTERLAWWRVRRLKRDVNNKSKRMDPLTRSWLVPQFMLLIYRFILSLLSMTFWIACLINTDDLTYLKWYSFWNYTVLMLYFLLSFLLTNVDACDPTFMDTGSKFEKVRRFVWILHAIMTVNGIASSIGVWVFVYNDASNPERYQLTQIRSIGTNIANVGFIVFELFLNCVPLMKWELIWCLVFAEVYVFSSVFSDHDQEVELIDWVFYHAESKTLLRFFVFTFLHIGVFWVVWFASNIKFKGVIENLWTELNHYDKKAIENPQYTERRVSHSANSKQRLANSKKRERKKKRAPALGGQEAGGGAQEISRRPNLESFLEEHIHAEDLYQRHSTWGEASHASSYSPRKFSPRKSRLAGCSPRKSWHQDSGPGSARPSYSRQSSWAAKRSLSRAEGEVVHDDMVQSGLEIVVDAGSGVASMIRKKPSPRPPAPVHLSLPKGSSAPLHQLPESLEKNRFETHP